MLAKMWDNFLFGVSFGIGFVIAVGVLRLIVSLIVRVTGGAEVPHVL